MKRLFIVGSLHGLLVAAYAQPQKFTDPQKTASVTGYFIKLLDTFVEKNVVTVTHLQHMLDAQDLVNPMTSEDRAASSTNLVYYNELTNYVESGKKFIDLAKVRVWIAAKIAELAQAENMRKHVHEDTREIHRPMRFVPIPAGKYIDQITHEEFEIPEGIEIQETPITQWQWAQITGDNPSAFVDGSDSEIIEINGKKIKMRPDAPVDSVDWNGAAIKILNLSQQEYAYWFPSVQEFQVVANVFKQSGSYAEYKGKRIWNVMGNVWQWTRDLTSGTVERSNLVFGGLPGTQLIMPSDMLRLIEGKGERANRVGLRLVRAKLAGHRGFKETFYSHDQLYWTAADAAKDDYWRWDDDTKLLVFDTARCMLEHPEYYSNTVYETVKILLDETNCGKVRPESILACLRNKTEIDLSVIEIPTMALSWFPDYNHEPILDIAPLATLTHIKKLRLRDNEIKNLKPLKDMVYLEELNVNNNHFNSGDLKLLEKFTRLTALSLFGNNIADISPLAGLVLLRELYLSLNEVSDLQPLAQLTQLEILHLYGNKITNIDALAGLLHLRSLDLQDNNISDISALKDLTQLEMLKLKRNPIQDLTVLKSLKNLKNLCLDDKQIALLHAKTIKDDYLYSEFVSDMLPGVKIHY